MEVEFGSYISFCRTTGVVISTVKVEEYSFAALGKMGAIMIKTEYSKAGCLMFCLCNGEGYFGVLNEQELASITSKGGSIVPPNQNSRELLNLALMQLDKRTCEFDVYPEAVEENQSELPYHMKPENWSAISEIIKTWLRNN